MEVIVTVRKLFLFTYLGDLQPTFLGAIIQLYTLYTMSLSTMDIPGVYSHYYLFLFLKCVRGH